MIISNMYWICDIILLDFVNTCMPILHVLLNPFQNSLYAICNTNFHYNTIVRTCYIDALEFGYVTSFCRTLLTRVCRFLHVLLNPFQNSLYAICNTNSHYNTIVRTSYIDALEREGLLYC